MKPSLALAAAAALLAVTACGADEKGEASTDLAAADVAQEVAELFADEQSERLDVEVDTDDVDVSCDDDLPEEEGSEVACEIESLGTVWEGTATSTGEEDDEIGVEWEGELTALTADHVSDLITREIENQGMEVDELDCQDGVSAEVGDAVTCDLALTDGREGEVEVTSTGLSEDGQSIGLDWKASGDGSTSAPEPTEATEPEDGEGGAKAHGTRYPDGNGDVTELSLEAYLGTTLSELSDQSLTADCPAALQGAAGSTLTCEVSARGGAGGAFEVEVVSEGEQPDGQIGFSIEILD